MPLPLSLTGRKWILPQEGGGGDLVQTLAEQRDIDVSHESTWNDLSDPLELGEMQKAVTRIRSAISHNEKIGIIGDYDADGITGTAQLVRYFRRLDIEPVVILPHRKNDGYGVKKRFIDAMKEKEVTLIVTIDTGVSAIEEVAYARSIGIDVVVTDHHAMREEMPDAVIIHPRLSEFGVRSSEFDGTCDLRPATCNLSGSGVVFTLVRSLEDDDWEEKDIDAALAAIGTVADIVPLNGENRAIVQLGLQAMNNKLFSSEAAAESRDCPVFQLASSVTKNNAPTTSTLIGFRIAPRINAAGRLADPMIALRALLEGGHDLDRLQVLNTQRQEATRRMMEVAEEIVDTGAPILILKSPMFHPGIIGLIAGKLTEKHGKPSVVACEEGNTITCSLRSIPTYHLADALSRCGKHLVSFGGHREAAGCTTHVDSWNAFANALAQDVTDVCGNQDFAPSITIDAVLDAGALSLDLVKRLASLEPFGCSNPEPRFLLTNQSVTDARQVGGDGSHLQLRVNGIKGIGFGLGHCIDQLPDCVDIVCRLGIDRWNGAERVQVFVEDVAMAHSHVSAISKF